MRYTVIWGFPGGSAVKESTCNAGNVGNVGSTPGSGRSNSCSLMDCRFLCPWDFPGEEYLSGLLFPPPGDLPDPGIELESPSLADGFFTTESPGEGNGNPLQYSCLEKSHGRSSLVGYSPCGRKELDMTEGLCFHRGRPYGTL